MKRTGVLIGIITLLICSLAFAQAQKKVPWMHLEVLENSGDPETVKVNLPISMIDVALDVVKDKNFKNGRLKFDHSDISVEEMKQLWNELKNAGDAEFVKVEKKDEKVTINRQGDLVLIKVINTRNAENVDIKVPVNVVDALFSGPGEELNLKSALTAMKGRNVGDIITVKDSKTHVRIWID
jgi:hypothetical protein